MSTSNNLDEKVLLHYITRTLGNWGMVYINQQTLKLAKKNDPECLQPMTRLLFDLSILHIFDYQYPADELKIIFQDEEQMVDIVMAHLFEIDCPMIVSFNEGKTGQKTVGLDFSSSRHILMTCGWIMAVSDFFSQTSSKLINKRMIQIYKPKPLDIGALAKKHIFPLSPLNLHEQSPKLQRISFLCKSLKSRRYTLECLSKKRANLLRRLKTELGAYDPNMTIQDIFSTSNSHEIENSENQLREMIVFQKQNMSYRKYWWIWLDQKIMALSYKDLAEEYEEFQRLECLQEDIKVNVKIDLNYPRKYIQTCQYYQQLLGNVNEDIERSLLNPKKSFRDVDRDITDQIAQARERTGQGQAPVPSFIGMQLKRYLKIGAEAKEMDPKQLRKAVEKSNKRLKQSISKFLTELQGIKLI